MKLGRILKRQHRPARATEVYRSLLQLQPDHPTAHYKLASVLQQQGRYEAAAEEYR
jgi:Flp pilus assembly protein TadD